MLPLAAAYSIPTSLAFLFYSTRPTQTYSGNRIRQTEPAGRITTSRTAAQQGARQIVNITRPPTPRSNLRVMNRLVDSAIHSPLSPGPPGTGRVFEMGFSGALFASLLFLFLFNCVMISAQRDLEGSLFKSIHHTSSSSDTYLLRVSTLHFLYPKRDCVRPPPPSHPQMPLKLSPNL